MEERHLDLFVVVFMSYVLCCYVCVVFRRRTEKLYGEKAVPPNVSLVVLPVHRLVKHKLPVR